VTRGKRGIPSHSLLSSQVEGVDIVVGGHTNTFLYSDDAQRHIRKKDERDEAVGDYPTVITQAKTGKKVLVVQTSGYGE